VSTLNSGEGAAVRVAGLWRYPVKSLAGESLDVAELTTNGMAGDRTVHVTSTEGLLTGRVRHRLVILRASTDPSGTPIIEGHRWDSAEAAELVRREAGPDARLVAYGGPERFDVANLLVATDGSAMAFGHDLRRLRPNIALAGVPQGTEQAWVGRALKIGDALIGVHSLRSRCVVTSIDPDTGDIDIEVFRRVRRVFGGKLCLNSWVIRPGRIHVGDSVVIADTEAEPSGLGGWVTGAPYRV
jgi:MOSC domain-containing protein